MTTTAFTERPARVIGLTRRDPPVATIRLGPAEQFYLDYQAAGLDLGCPLDASPVALDVVREALVFAATERRIAEYGIEVEWTPGAHRGQWHVALYARGGGQEALAFRRVTGIEDPGGADARIVVAELAQRVDFWDLPCDVIAGSPGAEAGRARGTVQGP